MPSLPRFLKGLDDVIPALKQFRVRLGSVILPTKQQRQTLRGPLIVIRRIDTIRVLHFCVTQVRDHRRPVVHLDEPMSWVSGSRARRSLPGFLFHVLLAGVEFPPGILEDDRTSIQTSVPLGFFIDFATVVSLREFRKLIEAPSSDPGPKGWDEWEQGALYPNPFPVNSCEAYSSPGVTHGTFTDASTATWHGLGELIHQSRVRKPISPSPPRFLLSKDAHRLSLSPRPTRNNMG
ncbi:hypothetical protein DFP72DRAFT_870698 [Ephemerocybe angulata]|uniref:Uncharacterized protein n=1 Tax=Ephemerocybe angulata TaxID=980116 RepID=A0A8H6IGS8_9AGAR|nr:hypothetical protein DFP72DRAFT_870698 [Tulosesus angulatus]